MNNKIFIYKWLLSVLIGLVAFIIGVIGFIIGFLEMGMVFSLFGAFIIIWYIAFVPYSFIFDDEKIIAIFALKKKTIKYVNIKACKKQESGIRNYPWGSYYHIIADKPFWQEIKMPSTKEIDCKIKKHITI